MPVKSRPGLAAVETELTESVRVVWEAYNAFGRGDLDGILQHVAADVSWELVGPPAIPFAGPRHGIEAVREFFITMAASVETEEFAFDEFIAQGERVVALGHERARAIATGQRYETRWIHVFTVRDGKIRNFREQADTAAILGALTAAPTAAAT